MSKIRRAPARVMPASSATSESVIVVWPGPNARMTERPRASDWTYVSESRSFVTVSILLRASPIIRPEERMASLAQAARCVSFAICSFCALLCAFGMLSAPARNDGFLRGERPADEWRLARVVVELRSILLSR